MTQTILSLRSLEYMSYARSPRPVCSMTIGIKFMGWLELNCKLRFITAGFWNIWRNWNKKKYNEGTKIWVFFMFPEKLIMWKQSITGKTRENFLWYSSEASHMIRRPFIMSNQEVRYIRRMKKKKCLHYFKTWIGIRSGKKWKSSKLDTKLRLALIYYRRLRCYPEVAGRKYYRD